MKWPAPWLAVPTALGASLAYAVYQGGSLAWHLLGFVVILSLMALMGQLGPLSRIIVSRALRPGPYRAGEALTISLTVRASRLWLWPYLLVVDHLPENLNVLPPRFVLSYLGRQAVVMKYQIPELKRGVYDINHLTVTTGDWFGLFTRSKTLSVPTRLVVWPRTISLTGAHLFPRRWQGENWAPLPTRQESVHVRGIREYVPGDRLSHVHWKTSAHTGDLKVKQFEPQTQPNYTVALDGSGRFSRQDWELAVSVAASLVQYANLTKQYIGLASGDEPDRTFEPISGTTAFSDMMNFLSTLSYQPGCTAAVAPSVGTRLIAVTPIKHADDWRSQAEVIIGIGPGGLTQLEHLPRALDKPWPAGEVPS